MDYGLQSKVTEWLNGLKKNKTQRSVAYKKNTSSIKQTQTEKKKEKDTPCQWKQTTKQEQLYLFISEKIRFEGKHKKRQTSSVYNDKGVNSVRGYNNCKYTCTQHWGTQIYKALLEIMREIGPKTIIAGSFNPLLSSLDRFPREKIKKEILDLIYTTDQLQMHLINICRVFHPMAAE